MYITSWSFTIVSVNFSSVLKVLISLNSSAIFGLWYLWSRVNSWNLVNIWNTPSIKESFVCCSRTSPIIVRLSKMICGLIKLDTFQFLPLTLLWKKIVSLCFLRIFDCCFGDAGVNFYNAIHKKIVYFVSYYFRNTFFNSINFNILNVIIQFSFQDSFQNFPCMLRVTFSYLELIFNISWFFNS